MSELRFDGRVAIVTGAGGNPSLGRAYALLLAERGAKVVVNDIGRGPRVQGYDDTASAELVVEEIRDHGGEAIANTDSVASDEGAAAIVQTAIDAYGRLDILINNAGLCVVAPFEEMTPEDFRRHIDTNLLGPVATCRAAWPHMKRQGYGRIVNATSLSMAGFRWQAAYAASKGGLLSFTRALAAEGGQHGIKANAINPGAFTRMVKAQQGESSSWYQYSQQNLPPELVSPVAAYLVHEECPVTGECIQAMGGEISRFYLAKTPGVMLSKVDMDAVRRNWSEAMSGASDGLVGFGDLDPHDWAIKPYFASDSEPS